MTEISTHIDKPAGVTFGVTPVTQASADSAAEGSSGAAARGDHKHGMPTIGNTTIASGTYVGNNGENRAIAHGLGATPKMVLIHTNPGGSYWHRIYGGYAFVIYTNLNASGVLAVTAPDATNFYVGNATDLAQSANSATSSPTYKWVAWT